MTTKITNANITNTGVSAGSYTNTNLTVNAQGQITAASNGTGGGGTPGGSDTQVQFNNAGAFGGSANFVWDNSNVRLGIGTASPAVTFEVDKTSGEALRVAATSANQSIYSRFIGGSPSVANFYVGVDSAAGGITGVSAAGMLWNAGNAGLAFGTNNTLKMSINADGTIKTSSTISVGGATPSTSGCGITFPASENLSTNANTLDDYEEGTWTPTVYGSTTNGTYTPSSNGVYVKIGKQVTCLADFTFSAATGGAGNVRIAGLPFNYFQSCAGLFSTVSVDTTSASALNMVLSTAGSPPSAVLYPTLCIDNGALEQIPITGVTTSSRFSIAFTYFIS